MKITTLDIATLFDDLLSCVRSRENVAEWANSIMSAGDAGDLAYGQPSDEGRIWSAVCYLSGIDLKNSDNVYLHSNADVEEFRKQTKL